MNEQEMQAAETIVAHVITALEDGKAADVVTLDVRGLSDATDFFVIASGTSDTHVRALARRVMDDLADVGQKPHHEEGVSSGRWGASGLCRRRGSRVSPRAAGVLPIRATLGRRAPDQSPFQRLIGTTRPVRTAILISLLAARAGSAQYFGQNRVQYRTLDFAVIETEHFDVHYDATRLRAAALEAALMVERAYQRLSQRLNHQYRERQPLILFGSHSEFQQNNITAIGEGVQGVTDPYRHRALLPFTDSRGEFEHVLIHELAHQFQFDIFADGYVGAGIGQLVAVRPPLWFMEGLAEYLSVGPVDALTAMWLRDAALHDRLPSVEALSRDPTIFPYRYGHALLAFIAERWGDDAIASLMHSVASGGLEFGLRMAINRTPETLTAEWHEWIVDRFAAAVPHREAPGHFAIPALVPDRSNGRFHVSPSLSPDGSRIAYFSDNGSYSVDLYLADADGTRRHRLVKGAFSADFESIRFIHSSGSWSPDGRYFAFSAKRGGRDDLVVYDVTRRRVTRRIQPDVDAVSNPTWSPDGRRIAFTGLHEGRSDLFIARADGDAVEQITDDRFAELHPAWAPDGARLAYATDKGPGADTTALRPGRFVLAIRDIETGVELLAPPLPEADQVNPQWAPDGSSLAFVSGFEGTANVFDWEPGTGVISRLTDVQTGVSGITALSPAISWAANADRLAFTVYENGRYNVYTVDDPRSRRSAPVVRARPVTRTAHGAMPEGDFVPTVRWRPITRSGQPPTERRLSVRALLDSALTRLPDSSTFTHRSYRPRLRPDYVMQPQIGYVRDNFGQGVFGGTAVALSDLLGNRRVLLGVQVNGRIEEAQVTAVYANLARRMNWALGYEQTPFFYFRNAFFTNQSGGDTRIYEQQVQRFILHRAFWEAVRPVNRFQRVEFGIGVNNVSIAELRFRTTFDGSSTYVVDQELTKTGLGHRNYLQPSLALVFDNTLGGWISPTVGRRSRLEYSPAIGDWTFHQALVDLRRYDALPGPITLATRMLLFGRFGRDSEDFQLFLGTPDLVRGYTAGSFRRRECEGGRTPGSCSELNQLVGSRVAVFNAEARLPLPLDHLLPFPAPRAEAAAFLDMGVAWRDGTRLVLAPRTRDDPLTHRAPKASWGVAFRTNLYGLMILRLDYSRPLNRADRSGFVTLSIGPPF